MSLQSSSLHKNKLVRVHKAHPKQAYHLNIAEEKYGSKTGCWLVLVLAGRLGKGLYTLGCDRGRLKMIKGKRPRVSVKGQILADIIVERPEEESPNTLMGEEEELLEPWILFTYGSSCTDGSRERLILTNPEGMEFTYALRFRFDATNNEAEYEALIVPRSKNKKADALSKIASTSFAHLSKQVLVEELKEKSISTVEVLAVVEEEGDTWMTPIFKYLMDGTLPAEVKKMRAVKRKSWRFSIINGTLYKKSFLGPWLRCVGPLQSNYVLREMHEGSCSMHAGTRSVVAKALRIGYYWPTMHEDARKLIRACQDCQVHKPVPRSPHGLKQNQWRPSLETKSKHSCGITSFVDLDSQEKSSRIMETNSKTIRSRTGARNYVFANILMNPFPFQDNPFKDCGQTVQNDEALEINLDLLEDRREQVAIQEAKSKAKMERYYNSKVRSTSFKPGDLVYRNNDASRAKDTGKLGPK
ncbi:reverse transcriptase domain-containing protein [Tanacetum coccineum]